MKECIKCGELKALNSFHKSKGYRDGHRNDCKLCRKIETKKRMECPKVREKARAWHVEYKYGISVEEYDALLKNPCAICGLESKVCDHDHITGKVRGALCSQCNTALGLLKDSTRRLNNAIKYLEDSCTAKNT